MVRHLDIWTCVPPGIFPLEGARFTHASREQIDAMARKKHMAGFLNQGFKQVMDLRQVVAIIKDPQAVGFMPVSNRLGSRLSRHPFLKENGVSVSTIFLSPLPAVEIRSFLKQQNGMDRLRANIAGLTFDTLTANVREEEGDLSSEAINYIRSGTLNAFWMMIRYACDYKYVLAKSGGAAIADWEPQLSESAKSLLDDFVVILQGGKPAHAEKWRKSMFSGYGSQVPEDLFEPLEDSEF